MTPPPIEPQSFMAEATNNRPAHARLELLGIEALEEHARRLAALFTTSQSRRGGNAHLKALRKHTHTLKQVYSALADDAKRGEPSSPAAEWLLDNFHIVLASLRDIHHDLPPSFFRRLPRIALAALAMGALLWLLTQSLPALAADTHGVVQAVLLLAVIAAGIAVYGLFLRLFGVVGWREAVNAVRRNAP